MKVYQNIRKTSASLGMAMTSCHESPLTSLDKYTIIHINSWANHYRNYQVYLMVSTY
jgi:hypothetical protein